MHTLISLIYIPIIIAIGAVATATVVYRTQRYLAYFSAFAYTLALWLLCQYISEVSTTHHGALIILRMSSALSVPLGYLFMRFVSSYVQPRDSRFKWYDVIPFAVFIPLNFTSLMIKQVTISSAGIGIKSAGLLYAAEIVVVFLYFAGGIFDLIRATVQAPRYARRKNYLLIIGIGQAVALIGVGSTLFAASTRVQLVVPASIFIMVLVIAFAIVRHRLFDIRTVVAKVLAYLSAILLLGIIYGIVVIGGLDVLLHNPIDRRSQFILSISLAVVSIVFANFKTSFDRLTNRIFFQDSYDSQELFSRLNRSLVTTLDIETLLNGVSKLIVEHIKVEYCTFWLHGTEYSVERLIAGQHHVFTDDLKKLTSVMPERQRRAISVSDLDNESPARRTMNDNDIAVLIRLRASSGAANESLGLVILGPKKSGNPFGAQDLRVLDSIADELVVAIQNALHFEEIQNFNTTLQQRIVDATRKLRSTNSRLRALDSTKDDFISMASHQLRTPLTSVKGYLSMVLDGDAGALNSNQTKLLEQAFRSSQQMVYLISDLLNLSRLNTGKFVIDTSPVDLSELIQSEVDQLTETAKARNLTLVYDKPSSFPFMMLDETKIHQVVMNFIDNAIYYTPAGGTVTVALRETPTYIEYTVKDNGIGVPKNVQHRLFSKFYRAENAQKARPDGTGLGLFMAKKVVVAQNGSIVFDSQEGKGSTFGFRFNKAGHTPPTHKTLTTT